MVTNTKWSIADEDLGRQIASINVAGFEEIQSAVSEVFQGKNVSYSGVIVSNEEALASGVDIEGSCYEKGGFVFLFKSYDDQCAVEGIDRQKICEIVNHLGSSYLTDVLGFANSTAVLDVAWAVCQRDGDYGTMHNHIPPDDDGTGRYSGMFYLQSPPCITPTSFPNGCLHIVVNNKAHFFPPIPGTVVIWPSWMMHGIHPFRGQGDRLGIAFDFTTKTS